MSAKATIPGVNNAVQKLEELADRMRSEDFGFRDNDVDNIDKVIDALYELETERRQIHDELEKQTINSSILRHRLKVLPGQIRDEIMEAVMSARLSNANVLLELQEKLKGMTATITALEKRARELEQENAVLHPERELLKQQHEEIISQLNQRMAEKASMQIALNETRDKVRQANQDIVDLEDGILQLKEDLIQERTEARQEKKRLKRAVTDTTQKTKEQKDQNVTKKIELDHAQEKLMDSEGKLDTVRKSIRRFETSRAKLEGEERALAAQLSKQLKMNDQMRIKGTEIMNKRIEEERRSRETLKELEDRIKKFQFDIDSESFRQQELGQKKVQLLSDLAAKEEVMAEDAVRVEELDTTLQASKEALNTKAEEVGSMKRENIDMSEEIEILAESHKAVLAQLNKQIEEYREQLSRERKERMEIQSLKDSVSKSLDDLKTENQFFMTEMTNVVQGGKKQHQELSNEGMQLQKTLKETEEEIEVLSENLEQAQQKYQTMFDDYQKRTDTIEKEVLSLEASLEEKKHKLDEQMPVFEELEVYFKQRNEEYDNMKKTIGELRKRKQSLEDQIKRIIKDKEMIKQPLGDLRSNLKTKRQKLMLQMQTHGKSTQEMEQQILTAGCKLRTVVEENFRFNEKCKKMEEDLANLQKDMDENERIKARLQDELSNQKQDLMKKWEADNMMQEFFASRDEATAEAFGRLLSRTEKRENKIDMITERLKEELHVLGGFLDNISNRRPQGPKRKVRKAKVKSPQEHKEQQGERSITPGKVVEAVAGANQESEESQERPDTGASPQTATAVASSPSLHSARQLILSARSQHSSRAGTPHSPRGTPHSLHTVTSSPRSALKSPKKAEGRRSPAKQAWFADSTKGRCDP